MGRENSAPSYEANRLEKKLADNRWEQIYQDACTAVNVAIWRGILPDTISYTIVDVGPRGEQGRLWVGIFEGDFKWAGMNDRVAWYDAADLISGAGALPVIRGISEDLG